MGRTYLYHPVSLMTIRGACAQNGFELGRITQTGQDVKSGESRYRAIVKAWPKGWEKKSQAVMKAWVNASFNLDIWCDWAGETARGEYAINLRTQLVNDDQDVTDVVPDADFERSEDA